jgi:hypothetical protein
MNRNNLWSFLEADDATAAQAPTTDPNQGAGSNPPGPPGTPTPPTEPQVKGLGDMEGDQEKDKPQPEDDVEQDPEHPDVDDDEDQGYEAWKAEFMKLAEKADTKVMLESVRAWKDKELEPPQSKFVKDNYQILVYREDANVEKAMKEIRNLVKQDLDKTNPGTTLMQHITATLEKSEPLKQILIKLSSGFEIKGALHRKFIAGITGAIQTGGGNAKEDLVYAEKGLTINISTRYATQFGEINLGKWALRTNDPEQFLSETELDRFKDGAPEEKQTLRRRIILESLAARYKKRSFIIHVNHPNGSTHAIGWDLGESLLAGYHDGKIVVRGHQSDERNAQITDAGDIVSLVDVDIMYIRETGDADDYGRPETIEVPFIKVKDCRVYLTADMDLLENASASLTGMFFREMPFNGNPSDLIGIRDSIPDLKAILNKGY